MLVVELAVLLDGFGSVKTAPVVSRICTVAVLVIGAAPIATIAVTVALAPAGIVPRLQLKLNPVIAQAPWVVVDDWKGTGKRSLSTTTGAGWGPLFVTIMVKTTKEPAFTRAGELMVICTSGAPGGNPGETAAEGADSGLLPMAFVACTVNV